MRSAEPSNLAMERCSAAVTTETHPHPTNFCGGNFQDWLEVNLLPECNGKCSWCIERNGYHPSRRASWQTIGQAAIDSGKKNIILLGGEPTLYKDLKHLVQMLVDAGRLVWVTTNGFLLGKALNQGALSGIAGVNISIHHYDLERNASIVGVKLKAHELKEHIDIIRAAGGRVRFNCNLIKGQIDSWPEIQRFISFAKQMGASVRFAELKVDGEGFVDLFELFGNEYGLTNDPFIHGCNHNTVIDGVPVNFRQMCGLQTPRRKTPVNPIQFAKQVLYYDGELYEGWQNAGNITRKARKNLLLDLAAKKLTVDEVASILEGKLP